MPWIACDIDLPFEPKTLDLAEAMGWQPYSTVGRLLKFWGWCLRFAPDGDLSRFTHGRIAQAMDLPTVDGRRLVEALVKSGWLDDKPYLRLHDWWSLVGMFLKGRYSKEPWRWKRIQELYESGKPKKVDGPERSRSGAGANPATTGSEPGRDQVLATVQNSTVHDSTEPPPPHPPRELQKPDDGDDGDGSERIKEKLTILKREIFRRSGIRRISETDEQHLIRLLERYGRKAIDACGALHGGIENITAYLTRVLEGRVDTAEMARRVQALLKKGVA